MPSRLHGYGKKCLLLPLNKNRKRHGTTGRTDAAAHPRRLYRTAAPRGRGGCAPADDRLGAHRVVHPLGTAGRGQDDAGADHRPPAGDAVLHPLGGDERREGRARRHRAGTERPLLQFRLSDPLHRRDPPLLQVAAGLAARRRGEGDGDAHRGDDGEPVVRGDTAAALPLPALCAQAAGEGRPAGAAPPGGGGGHGAEETAHRPARDGCPAALQRRRRPQAAEHPRADCRCRAGRHGHRHRPHRGGAAAAEPPCLRQGRRDALRHHLGVHQVDPGLRPRGGSLLDGAHDRGRRGPEVHRPEGRHQCGGGHRTGESQRPPAGERRLRCRDEDRMARGTHPAGRGGGLPGTVEEGQLRLQSHQ